MPKNNVEAIEAMQPDHGPSTASRIVLVTLMISVPFITGLIIGASIAFHNSFEAGKKFQQEVEAQR